MTPYTSQETKLFKKLDTPKKIQDFLAFKIRHNPAKDGVECRSPRRVLREGKAHCMEGALLAAAILEFHGQKPLVLDLRSTSRDLDHVVALFKQFGRWGAISKTNHAVLRYREPIFRSVRELVLSYFHEYFLDSGKKTLREYSAPFDLRRLDKNSGVIARSSDLSGRRGDLLPETRLLRRVNLKQKINATRNDTETWRTTEQDLWQFPHILDKTKHFKILNRKQIKNLRKADRVEIKAGILVEWKSK